jgi:tripartite-type tricarboxylate transporter receptor subunit TctC
MDELDVKGFDVSTLYGLLAPRATPASIVEQLSAAMRQIGARPEIQAQMLRQGADARTSTPQETDAILRSEVEKWAAVARMARLD